MTREYQTNENTPFRCSQFAPYDGKFMLDDVVVTPRQTQLFFTEDLGTVITAGPARA